MKIRVISFTGIVLAFLATFRAEAQQIADCSCFRTQAVLQATGCFAQVPDMCQYVQCYMTSGQLITCSQSPAANTFVPAGTHVITITLTDPNGQSQQCAVLFTVNQPQTGPFALLCASNKTVQCDSTWAFDPPTATNECCNAAGTPGNVTISVLSTITNGVCPQVITRTWQGVDDCGHTNNCTQTVTVVDNTPPTINCGQNETVSCGLGWGFTVPIISDNCTAPSDLALTIVSTTTNFTCLPTFVATRIWKVTDLCGNSTMCTQVVTLVDFTPPTITCANNKTVECGTQWSFDNPTVSDNCGGPVTLNVVSTTTSGTCPQVITRTWTATDGCGNTSQPCSQTVTVVDTKPPSLNCSCLEDPTVVQLTVVACSNAVPDLCALMNQCAQDDCGPLTCSQTPAAGTIVFPGSHPITVTVTDCATNTVSCTVVFTVVAPPEGCSPCPDKTRSWNTGTAPRGQPDPFYKLISAPPGGCIGPAQVVTNPHPLWVANGPNSRWIGADGDAWCQPGVYHYQLCFYLACTDGAAIIGQWTSDDGAQIYLNGQPTANTVPSQQFPNNVHDRWHPVSITNGFVCGMNCIDFYVTNANIGINATGLRAELTNIFNECCCTNQTNAAFSVNSGANANGPLPTFAQDPQFTLSCAPPGVPLGPVVAVPAYPGWIPNSTQSQWVSPFPNHFGPEGVYCYELRFNLPPCDEGIPLYSLTGRWAADNEGVIYLNGSPTGYATPLNTGFLNWSPINISSGLVPGPNTLTFYVTNQNGPTGLRLELAASVSCCDCTNHCDVAISCPPDIDQEICGPQEIINYLRPSAVSSCGPITSIVCNPPSGSLFNLGFTMVTCTATDALGNSATCSFQVVLRPDTTPPRIDCECLQKQLLTVQACRAPAPNLCAMLECFSDNCTPPNGLTCQQSPPAGTMLPPGSHFIVVTIFDQAGNSNQCAVLFTVASPVGSSQVWNTGRGGPGGNVVLAPGTPDPNFTLVSFPAGGCPGPAQVIHPSSIPSPWLPNGASPSSQWIGPAQFVSQCPAGVYHYRVRFSVPCGGDAASINGRWTADDSARMILNGNPSTVRTVPSPGNPSQSFQGWHAVNISSGFLPGANVLDIYVTNATVYTGLRAELILRFSCCCPEAVAINCPLRPLRAWVCKPTDLASVPYNITASSACGGTVSVKCEPPSPGPFPVGASTVTCTATDSLGNQNSCAFAVIVSQDSGPPKITCPKNLTFLTCNNGLNVSYAVQVQDDSNLPTSLTCTPIASGGFFPVGTTVVTCTATDACGNKSTCSFNVKVNNVLAGPPTATFTGGNPDNFAGGIEAAPTNACIMTAFSNYPFWKGFDQTGQNRLLGYRFTGLPNNIVQAQFEIRMRPSDDGSENDGLFMGLGSSCTFASFVFSSSISVLPGAVPPTGGTWVTSSNGATTFTFNMNPALISKMNTDQFLDVVIHDDTTVDYMRLRLWTCPPKHPGIGIPFEPISATTFAIMPKTDEPDDLGPTLILYPDASTGESGVTLHPGTPDKLHFTTQVRFDASPGATLSFAIPGDSGAPQPLFTLSREGGGWDLKLEKKPFVDEAGRLIVTAANTNCDFGSFSYSGGEPDPDYVARFTPMNDMEAMTLITTIDCDTREITFEVPECLFTPDAAGRKGWDGCIYGPDRPVKKPKAARLVVTPDPPLQPRIRLGTVPFALMARGLPEVKVEDPGVSSQERKWGDGHVTLMKAYDDEPTMRKIEFTTFDEGGGVHVDLGRADTFRVGIHHFENGDIPTEEQLFRIIGPPVLINRPSPPTNYLRLARGADGVHCTVDFSDIGATAIRVELWNDGVLVGAGVGPGPTIPPESPLILSRWVEFLGRPSLREGIVLTSSEDFAVSGITGDEVRILPELPAGTERMSISRLEVITSAGMESILYELETTSALAPTRLNIRQAGENVVLDWHGDGYTLQGAENVEGPWIDVCDPPSATGDGNYEVTVPAKGSATFYRLSARVMHF